MICPTCQRRLVEHTDAEAFGCYAAFLLLLSRLNEERERTKKMEERERTKKMKEWEGRLA